MPRVGLRGTVDIDLASQPLGLDRDGKPKMRTEELSRTRVRVSQITSLSNDLALALATPSIRIEAPVPGKSVLGIEVPNSLTSLVTLRGVIESTPFQKLGARSKLALALGKSVAGEPVAVTPDSVTGRDVLTRHGDSSVLPVVSALGDVTTLADPSVLETLKARYAEDAE